MVGWPSGKAKVRKTFYSGSIPLPTSKKRSERNAFFYFYYLLVINQVAGGLFKKA